jgi:O-acetyl-ADP-ribose deacetylase (regulator of RNase III)
MAPSSQEKEPPRKPGRFRGCRTGDAKITKGGRLPAKFVIHTVGPVWRGGADGEPALLARCYLRAIEIAADRGLASVAFPGISTGIYGYPVDLAARVAVAAVREGVSGGVSVHDVIFCCFSAEDLACYQRTLGEPGA